ncbi:hypothetical protein KAFR_0A02360 [Kazachstania africana CBS 2517]|uniref:Thioredoxin domain-containing protein n=1 Tax=Kazachstania africana (strain ATCC 22294 / BCRC 22015 / CBS 2517 / CECT 1963 / NBRC 1671 / NRRL Y-8276) TaxID=1071382 RepID=H2AMS4_KAZAF|nr:hypothetical protein KAFR_0A02360 [Kazachstania africana CBS 2517]CCF55674.1 hypothetical protein KAFR_0A02360 [Kazachstania africana CBS 2517]
MAVIEVESQDEFTLLTTKESGEHLITLYFHTSWAEPCRQMNEIYKAVSEEPSNKDIVFLSIDADSNAEISELFDVNAVPYFVLIQNGSILKEQSGADPKDFINTLEECKKFISNQQAKDEDGLEEEDEEAETEEEIADRLSKLVKAAPVMLFMKGNPSEPKCGFSRQIVGILREHQVRFGFFDILKDDAIRQSMKKFSDWPTFPQLYINGEFQGGLDIIKESLEEDPEFFQHALQA